MLIKNNPADGIPFQQALVSPHTGGGLFEPNHRTGNCFVYTLKTAFKDKPARSDHSTNSCVTVRRGLYCVNGKLSTELKLKFKLQDSVWWTLCLFDPGLRRVYCFTCREIRIISFVLVSSRVSEIPQRLLDGSAQHSVQILIFQVIIH